MCDLAVGIIIPYIANVNVIYREIPSASQSRVLSRGQLMAVPAGRASDLKLQVDKATSTFPFFFTVS